MDANGPTLRDWVRNETVRAEVNSGNGRNTRSSKSGETCVGKGNKITVKRVIIL